MKKVVWPAFLAAIISFIVLSNDPLNDTVNFIISGNVPGTDISFGFWSTMALALVLFILIRKALKNAQHKMMVLETERENRKRTKANFEESNKIEFDTSKRSVIAAGNSELVI